MFFRASLEVRCFEPFSSSAHLLEPRFKPKAKFLLRAKFENGVKYVEDLNCGLALQQSCGTNSQISDPLDAFRS